MSEERGARPHADGGQTPPREPKDRLGRLALVAILAVAVLITVQVVFRPQLPVAGSEIPSLRFEMLDAEPLEVRSLVGKVVLLDFWATWCPPCVESMPVLEKVSRELAPEGVVAIAINRDEAAKREELVRRFLAKHRLEGLRVALDDGAAAGAFGITGLPTLIVLGRDGNVFASHLGSIDERTLRALVEQALKAPMPREGDGTQG